MSSITAPLTTPVPKHIAIIMDGNRRWAKKNNLNPSEGHKAGAKNLEDIVEHAAKLGIKHVTVYALSTENWRKRTKEEVTGIFRLLINYLQRKRQMLRKSGIRIVILGDFHAFPLRVRLALKKALSLLVPQENLKFNIALNYGGRDEIVHAIKNIIKDKVKPNDITEDLVAKYLYTHDQPDPDLIIRPGGEKRLSNFLLWQASYSEFYFTDTLWPDFGPKELEKAIAYYQSRERRLGK